MSDFSNKIQEFRRVTFHNFPVSSMVQGKVLNGRFPPLQRNTRYYTSSFTLLPT